MDAYTLNKVKIQTLPHGAPHAVTIKLAGGVPLLPTSTKSVDALIQKGLEKTTKGQFADAQTHF